MTITAGSPEGRQYRVKASDAVGAAWVIITAVFWGAAGLAAADGSAGAAFAYAIVPLAFMPVAGLIMGDLDKKRKAPR